MGFLDDLAARRRFGMKPGLDTIRALCAAMGNPQERLKAIHVAGTNGKGAVCAILDAALRNAGLRVGRYTSPHLVRLNERFFLDGAPVDDVTLENVAREVSRAASGQRSEVRGRTAEELTFFEALTAVAFCLYDEAEVDFAVLECGLGGRLDATNVCSPSLCVITRIGLDHCDWLGDTVEKIAAEKAGIIKKGVPAVLGRNEPSVRAVVEARAKEVGAPFHYAPDLADESEVPADFPLIGSFNRENAVTALAALKVLAAGENPGRRSEVRGQTMDDTSLRLRLSTSTRIPSSVVWPGRFQRVGNFIVDGAHNPPAARALVNALSSTSTSGLNLISGFCGDKDADEVLSILAPLVKRGYAVRTNNPRSLSAGETAVRMRKAGIDAVPCTSLREAMIHSSSLTTNHQPQTTLVCGSLFLAGEALVELGAYPWPAGRFDPSEALNLNEAVEPFKVADRPLFAGVS